MKHDSKQSKMLVCLLSLGFLAVGTGCTDSDFDLSKIDSTIGIGGDGFVLPTNDTEDIILDDILDLKNSDFVKIDENTGNYIFYKNGDDCTTAHPFINKVTVSQKKIDDGYELEIPTSSFMSAAKRARARRVSVPMVNVSNKVVEFKYSGAVSSDILDLKTASVSSNVKITVNLNNDLKKCISTFKTLTLTLPSYMELDVTDYSPKTMTYDKSTGKVEFTNVSTSSPIYLTGVINKLYFDKSSVAGSHLTFTSGKQSSDGTVDLLGEVTAAVTFDDVNTDQVQPTSRLVLTAKMQMGAITINSAYGKFDPAIDLSNLGQVDINNVPDFLSDKDVTINLYNPYIELTVNSDLSIGGKLSGKIIAEDENGNKLASVVVPQLTIKPNHENHLCIYKRAEGLDLTKYDDSKQVANLSDLMTKIPKKLRFEADANADATTYAEIQLGHSYTVAPSYSVSAPLAFDENAQIVYRDSIDGWHDDIKDLDLADGAYIELTSDIVNKLPANLTVSAKAMDTEGKEMSTDRIEVVVSNTVKGTEDATKPATTPITITLKEKQKGAFKDLDGLKFKIEAASGDGEGCLKGVTLNAYNQTLKASNLKVRLVGKLIADFN